MTTYPLNVPLFNLSALVFSLARGADMFADVDIFVWAIDLYGVECCVREE